MILSSDECGAEITRLSAYGEAFGLAGPPWRSGAVTTSASGHSTASSRSSSAPSSTSSSPGSSSSSPGGLGGASAGGMHGPGGFHRHRGYTHHHGEHRAEHDMDNDAVSTAVAHVARGVSRAAKNIVHLHLASTGEEAAMTELCYGKTPLRVLGAAATRQLELSGQLAPGTTDAVFPPRASQMVALSAGEPTFDGMSMDELDAAEMMFSGDWDESALAELTGVPVHEIEEKIELTAGYGSGFVVEGRERAVLLAAVAKDLLNLAGNGRDGTEHAEYAGRHHHAHTHQRAHSHPHEHHGGGAEHIHAHLEADDAGNHPGQHHHIARLAADGAHAGFEGVHDHPHEHAVPHVHRHRHGSMGTPDADHESHDHSALEPGTDDAGITGGLGKLDFRNADMPGTTYPSPDQLAAHDADQLAARHPEYFSGGKIKGVTHVSVQDGGHHEAAPGHSDSRQPALGGQIHPDVAALLDRNPGLFAPPGPQAELRQQRQRQLLGPLGGRPGSGPVFPS